MTAMRNVMACWAPECTEPVTQPATGRPQRYHSKACKMRAYRRNGNKAPSEPYPPFEVGAVVVAPPPPAPKPKAKPKARQRRTVKPAGASNPPAAATDESPGPLVEAPTNVTQLHVAVTQDSTVPVKVTVHPMVAAYRGDLAKIGQEHTRQGLQVIEMAEKLVSSATSPAAAANLSKELQRLMGELEAQTTDALVSQDPSLVIRDRTLAKLRALQEPAEEATA